MSYHTGQNRERQHVRYLHEGYERFCAEYYEKTYSVEVRNIVDILNRIRRNRGYLMYAPVTHAEVKAWLESPSGCVLQRWEAWLFEVDGTPHSERHTPENLLRRFSTRRR